MINVSAIQKSFRRLTVLHTIDLQAKKGSITLLTSANGCEKSTLLKILVGLHLPDRGKAEIQGFDVVKDRLAAQRVLSFLPQNVNFHPATTPQRLLKFYSKLRGVSPERGYALLEEVGLEDALKRPVSQLSGGMRQRLGLALTFMPDAPVLILDEPGAGLDPEWRVYMRTKLLEEAQKGKNILLTTHQAEEWDCANQILNFEEGKIVKVQSKLNQI